VTPLIEGEDAENGAGPAGEVIPDVGVVAYAVDEDDGSPSGVLPIEIVKPEAVKKQVSADRLIRHLHAVCSFFCGNFSYPFGIVHQKFREVPGRQRLRNCP
jgi:hypothetical protein